MSLTEQIWICDVQSQIVMGKGGGSSSPSNTTSTVTQNPPDWLATAYQSLLPQAQAAASTPYTPYSGQIVAQPTQDITTAQNTIASTQGMSNPYAQAGTAEALQGSKSIYPQLQQANAQNIGQYMSPYNQDVINATMAQAQQNDAQQQSQLMGQAIQSGASPFGGDRAGVAAAALAGQQDLANNQTIAGLNNQNYTQALGEFNNQQQTQANTQASDAWRQLSAAQLLPSIGNINQQDVLSQANAQLASGQVQQNQNQANLNVPYQQYQAQQSYPFQTLGWLGGLESGLGGVNGGTATTSAPPPSATSQALGLGSMLFGAAGSSGGFGNLFGMKKGGVVPHFAGGGYAGVNPFTNTVGVPDVSVSWVPKAPSMGSARLPSGGGSGSGSSGSSMSPAQVANIAKGLGSLFSSSGSSGGGVDFAGMMGNSQTGGDWLSSIGQGGQSYGLNNLDYGSMASSSGAGSDAFSGLSGSGGDWLSSIGSDAGSFFKKGGIIPRHLASGGGSDPMTFLGMGSGSGNGPSQSNISHDNKWMSQGGDWVGSILGSFFGGPVGGYVGGKAGSDAGGTLGDLFGGNWKSLGSDIKAGPIGTDPIFKMVIGDNNSAAGQGNSPQLGGNFSGTTLLSAYGDGNAGAGGIGGGAGKAGAGIFSNYLGSLLSKGGIAKHYDNGGAISAMSPSMAMMQANPITQQQNQQYASLPIDKLQQLAAQQPNNAMVQKALKQKEMSGGMARGGIMPHFDDGGVSPAQDVMQDVAAEDSSNGIGSNPAAQLTNNPISNGIGQVSADDLLPPDARGIAPPATTTNTGAPPPEPTGDLDGQPQVDHSGDTVKIHYPSEKKTVDTGIPSTKPSPWEALMAAGLTMMMGKSPNALENIGQGGLTGLEVLGQQRQQQQDEAKLQADLALRQQQADREAQRDQELAAYHQGLLDVKRGDSSAPLGQTAQLIQQLRADNPKLSVQDALNIVQNGGASPASSSSTPMSPPSVASTATGTPPTYTRGEEYLSSIDPAQADRIRSIYNGREKLTAYMQRNQDLMGNLYRAYPDFNSQSAAVMGRVMTGKDADNIQSLNTSIMHINTGEKLIDALDNGDVPAFNSIANWYSKQTGKPAVTNFDAVRDVVGDEVTKSIVGGQNAEADRAELKNRINSANSPQQLKEVLDNYKVLMAGRVEPIMQRYTEFTHNKDFMDKMLLPQAKEAITPLLSSEAKKLQGMVPDNGQQSGNTPAQSMSIPPAEQRQIGQTYTNSNGVSAKWTGSGWVAQ